MGNYIKEKYKQIIKMFDAQGNELESVVNEFTFEQLEKFPEINSNNKEQFQENTCRKTRSRKHNKYRVSNKGNIEIFDDNKKVYIPAKIKDKGKGWLILEKYPSVYIYQLVAETWLKKPDNSKGWQIHHINNKGCNNRPENLIYIKRKVHNKLPKK